MAVKETVTFPIAPMILAVKKPDYLGTSKWELRFGKRAIAAKIEDEGWLSNSSKVEKLMYGPAICRVAMSALNTFMDMTTNY